ncbi:MAG TPA: helix-turn-helix transcriptional regulator [Steroidobacteraceae bacterium]|jgi:AraC-like DNA-binding protein|nr:helix-turn-helix transcriptional regulator [Steroidobacteraceae bacterium]
MRPAAHIPDGGTPFRGSLEMGGLQPGLFRREALSSGPAGTMTQLFADLRRVNRGELIAENPERHLQGTRLRIARTEGEATWDLYRLGPDLYVVAADGVYDSPRIETVPGEGLIEFHLRLAGTLEMTLPGSPQPVKVTGPRLLMMHQPPGVDVSERVLPKVRDSGVSLYCRRGLLAELARLNTITRWALLEDIDRHGGDSVWHRQFPLSATLLYIGKSLLESPYRRGVRLLHAEAKALELLCEMLASAQEEDELAHSVISESEARQLDTARRMLATNLSAPLKIGDIARYVAMSESKLNRAFKSRFGITVFDYGLECRMRTALELLRCRRMSVSEAAYAVGYRHPTSFTAAFQQFFGFLPSKARGGMR